MAPNPRVRIPILEGGGTLLQDRFAITSRWLFPEERKMLLAIFGPSINLDVVKIVYTNLGVKNRPYTLGNYVRIPKGSHFAFRDLVHEVTHIWQYQTQGAAYITDSTLHQLVQGLGVYKFDLVPGQSFYNYTAEQQAMIVQRYYEDAPEGWRTDPDVVRMIEEVRKARPLAPDQIQQDIWNVPTPNPSIDPGAPQITPTVPIFRIEWW